MKTKKHNWKRWLPLYLMMAPGLIYIFINNYIPMFGTIIAFKHINYQKGILGSDWVGLKNFNFDTYNSLTPNWYYKVLR